MYPGVSGFARGFFIFIFYSRELKEYRLAVCVASGFVSLCKWLNSSLRTDLLVRKKIYGK